MVAAIRVYADTADNKLLFDSSKATIPTLFAKKTFKLSDITPVGTGYDQVGRINVAGLDPTKHFSLSIQTDNSELNSSLHTRGAQTHPNIHSGYFIITYEMYIALKWFNTYYPNAVYFVNLLELN